MQSEGSATSSASSATSSSSTANAAFGLAPSYFTSSSSPVLLPPVATHAPPNGMTVPVLQQPMGSAAIPVHSAAMFPTVQQQQQRPVSSFMFAHHAASNPVNLLTEAAEATAISTSATAAAMAVTTTASTSEPLLNLRVKRSAPETSSIDEASDQPTSPTMEGSASPTKKHKISRERQLRINAASRRCRKRQKMEVKFLRTHVVELQNALKEQLMQLQQPEPVSKALRHARIAHLSMLLDESIKKTEEMSPEIRRSGATAAVSASIALSPTTSPGQSASTSPSLKENPETTIALGDEQQVRSDGSTKDETSSDESTRSSSCTLSDSKKRSLLDIAEFIKRNISLESRACIPEVISCLPIDIDGWQLRISIDEKHYTTHIAKFFPVNYLDMFEFCWEKHVTKEEKIAKGRNSHCHTHFYKVTPLTQDVAHVDAKVVGSWTSSVHGVPHLGYKSLVCCLREEADESHNARALICQQSVVDPEDLEDHHAVSWLFRRWLSFQPYEQDGVQGTLVESYRTGSYATGMVIYKGNKRYDDFCEHLIRRYVECNALLETFMAKDPRFRHLHMADSQRLSDDQISELVMRDLLLF